MGMMPNCPDILWLLTKTSFVLARYFFQLLEEQNRMPFGLCEDFTETDGF